MDQRLAGKVMMVTGASSGIGLACAERFVREGAVVHGFDVSEKPAAWAALEKDAPGSSFVVGDVRDEAAQVRGALLRGMQVAERDDNAAASRGHDHGGRGGRLCAGAGCDAGALGRASFSGTHCEKGVCRSISCWSRTIHASARAGCGHGAR